jgi:hypothetical protein
MTSEPKGGSSREGPAGLLDLKCAYCGDRFFRAKDAPYHVAQSGDVACFDCFGKQFTRGRPVARLVVGMIAKASTDHLWLAKFEDSPLWVGGRLDGRTDVMSAEDVRAMQVPGT